MARVSYANPQVSAAVTYNWSASTQLLGDLDLCTVNQDAPGVGTSAGGLNTITTSILPRVPFVQQLGMIVQGWEPTLGGGEFIFLKVATVTAVPLGTLVQWDATYTASVVPTASAAKTGVPVAVCIANTVGITGGITSQTPVQYAWFQIQGQVQTLCTAVIRTVNGKVFVSGTDGRVMVTSASSKQILGARFAASNSATISMNLVYFNRSCVQSNIT